MISYPSAMVISTHALTEGDDTRADHIRSNEEISTHALTEGDLELDKLNFKFVLFQLTPSQRATA